jgi:hypothetical protein
VLAVGVLLLSIPVRDARRGYRVDPPAEGGTIRGRVSFAGEPPVLVPRRVESEACGSGTRPSQALVTGPDRSLAGVVVTLPGIQGGKGWPERSGPDAVLDLARCEFVPHVLAIPVGGELEIVNSDSILHTVHAYREDGGTVFIAGLPIPGQRLTKKLRHPGVLRLQSDAGHDWMEGWIVTADSPYFALTPSDGRFEIGEVPPGRHVVRAWHELFGVVEGRVTVPPGADAVIDLTFPAVAPR